MKDYAQIARSLYSLIPLLGSPVLFSGEGGGEQNVFDSLIKALTSSPTLGYADYTKNFCPTYTDASQDGLGANLYQDQEDGRKVIAYTSRSL